MGLIRINKDPSRRDLRLFAGVWLPLFFFFVGFQIWRKTGALVVAAEVWAAAAAGCLVCLASPRAARAVYVGLSYVTFPIGFVVSHVVVAVTFFAVVTPVGLLLRLFGHDTLKRRFDAGASTYWTKRLDRASAERYFRQY